MADKENKNKNIICNKLNFRSHFSPFNEKKVEGV